MYTQSITRTHRTAIILAIDGSGSMAEKIRFRNRQMTKAEAVATITNGMLFELIERARRSDGVRDYYDIAVIGYSGDDEVYSLLPGGRELISVAELAAGEPPIKTEVIEYRLPDGSISLREIPYPAWVEPEAAGQTPMCEALRRVRDIADARQMIMYLSHKHTTLSSTAIGNKLNRKHATVLHGIAAVKDRLPYTKELSDAVESIEKVLSR